MDMLQLVSRDARKRQIVPAEMVPDQAEGTVGLPILAQWCAAMMVVEDSRGGIIGAADIIDHPTGGRRNPAFRAGAPISAAGNTLVKMTDAITSSA